MLCTDGEGVLREGEREEGREGKRGRGEGGRKGRRGRREGRGKEREGESEDKGEIEKERRSEMFKKI